MKYKLPKDFAAQWIAALRSGKYKQGKNQLYSEDTYCCLGVACAMQSKVDLGELQWLFPWMPKTYGITLPKELIGKPENNRLVNMLSYYNDKGSSFTFIADWIENNVKFY